MEVGTFREFRDSLSQILKTIETNESSDDKKLEPVKKAQREFLQWLVNTFSERVPDQNEQKKIISFYKEMKRANAHSDLTSTLEKFVKRRLQVRSESTYHLNTKVKKKQKELFDQLQKLYQNYLYSYDSHYEWFRPKEIKARDEFLTELEIIFSKACELNYEDKILEINLDSQVRHDSLIIGDISYIDNEKVPVVLKQKHSVSFSNQTGRAAIKNRFDNKTLALVMDQQGVTKLALGDGEFLERDDLKNLGNTLWIDDLNAEQIFSALTDLDTQIAIKISGDLKSVVEQIANRVREDFQKKSGQPLREAVFDVPEKNKHDDLYQSAFEQLCLFNVQNQLKEFQRVNQHGTKKIFASTEKELCDLATYKSKIENEFLPKLSDLKSKNAPKFFGELQTELTEKFNLYAKLSNNVVELHNYFASDLVAAIDDPRADTKDARLLLMGLLGIFITLISLGFAHCHPGFKPTFFSSSERYQVYKLARALPDVVSPTVSKSA